LRKFAFTSETWTAVSAIAAVLATLLAAWATMETRRGVAETAKATRAGVLLQVLTEYAEPEMLNSMKALREWREDDPQNFAEKFQRVLIKREKNGEEAAVVQKLDEDRRRVGSFFNKLRVLADGGIIDERFVSATWSSGTYTYIMQVLLPLERAKTEALFALGSISQEDRAVSAKIEKRMASFYQRVAERSKDSPSH
jgi:hypothetical protein